MKHPGHVLQRQAVLAHVDHVVQLPGLIGEQPAAKPDDQAVPPPGQVLVAGGVHQMSSKGRGGNGAWSEKHGASIREIMRRSQVRCGRRL